MYRHDTFFHLSQIERVGLVCLSLTLFVLVIMIARRVLMNRPVWLRVLGALALLWLFVWLSPQIYYQYYRMIIDALPQQLVIQTPPGPGEVLQLLTFQSAHTLARHAQGILGWCLLAAPLLKVACRGDLTGN